MYDYLVSISCAVYNAILDKRVGQAPCDLWNGIYAHLNYKIHLSCRHMEGRPSRPIVVQHRSTEALSHIPSPKLVMGVYEWSCRFSL
jgi:hypothetical protein